MKDHLLGKSAEALAAEFLRALGWRILAQNFRFRGGEIDLIAIEQTTLVFVEVRARRDYAMVDGLSSVGAEKQRRIIQAARLYLAKQASALSIQEIRFDVISARQFPNKRLSLHHTRHAFTSDFLSA